MLPKGDNAVNNLLYILAKHAGIVTLSPSYGNMLGGSPIVVSGPYFTVEEKDQIACLFDNTTVDGIFVNKQQVLCVSPALSQSGRVQFQLFLRGNTSFYGESTFVSGRPDVHVVSTASHGKYTTFSACKQFQAVICC